jgi:polar amino acid transport system permease protein
MDTTSSSTSLKPVPAFQARVTSQLSELPWWVLFILLIGVFLVYNFATNAKYQDILKYVSAGVQATVIITLSAFGIAIVIGLLTAFGQLSKNTIIRNIAQFYVQIVRGIPILVLIFYTALVIIPVFIGFINSLGSYLGEIGLLAEGNRLSAYNQRDVSYLARGVVALAIAYGAFSSEIFRAGIVSIEKGQIEASHALGLNWFKTMRLVILPQAIRRILPPLGNDFIAMLKESSLVSVLGVNEITQLAKKYWGASFLYPETLNTLAFLYLTMTLLLSMGVKTMEKRMQTEDR